MRAGVWERGGTAAVAVRVQCLQLRLAGGHANITARTLASCRCKPLARWRLQRRVGARAGAGGGPV